jgi:hypothetical protein
LRVVSSFRLSKNFNLNDRRGYFNKNTPGFI